MWKTPIIPWFVAKHHNICAAPGGVTNPAGLLPTRTLMLRIVLLQIAATVLTGLIAGLLAGKHALFSALLGGLCYVVPNALFALRLFMNAQKPGGAGPMAFFIGEFVKIALTVALLAAVVLLYRDLNWLALIAAFIVALKSYIILLFRH